MSKTKNVVSNTSPSLNFFSNLKKITWPSIFTPKKKSGNQKEGVFAKTFVVLLVALLFVSLILLGDYLISLIWRAL